MELAKLSGSLVLLPVNELCAEAKLHCEVARASSRLALLPCRQGCLVSIA